MQPLAAEPCPSVQLPKKKECATTATTTNIGRAIRQVLVERGAELANIVASKGVLTAEKAAECQETVRKAIEQSRYSFKQLITDSADLHFALYLVSALTVLTKKSYSSYLVTDKELHLPGILDMLSAKVHATLDKLCISDVWITARKYCESKFAEQQEMTEGPIDVSKIDLPTSLLGLLTLRNGRYFIDCLVPLSNLTSRTAKVALAELIDIYSNAGFAIWVEASTQTTDLPGV